VPSPDVAPIAHHSLLPVGSKESTCKPPSVDAVETGVVVHARRRQVSHIAQHANQAVDQLRRQEHRALQAEGKGWLAGTKCDWLRHPDRFTLAAWRAFVDFARRTKLKTGRAWALKEMLMTLWGYRYPGAADRHFTAWYQWAVRSRLEPKKRPARMLKRHWPQTASIW
jgi:transposase